MLALLLKTGDRIFAIPARSVLEVVPRVALRPAPESPPWLAGLLAYRGSILPAVDLCIRVEGRPTAGLLSSRIVVVKRASGDPRHAYGILSENVTEVRQLADAEVVRVEAEIAEYVAGTIMSDGQIIHLLDLDSVLPRREPATALERLP